MNSFSRLATTALTGLAILGFASSAFAHHIQHQPFVEEETVQLLAVAESLGITVHVDPGICEKGLYGAMTTAGQLIVCTEAHGDDLDELADTIRHELLHAAQFCKGHNNGATSALLRPEYVDESVAFPQEHLHWNILDYDPGKWNSEGEARTMAYFLDEKDVADWLVQECGAGRAW